MTGRDITFTIAGICMGIIFGALLQHQIELTRTPAAPAAQAAEAAPAEQAGGSSGQQQKSLDEARVQQLTTILNSDPKNAGAMVQLGNTYFDAQKYPEAIDWYEKSLQIDPKNPDASTDLGVSYYYTNRADEALKQFETSLRMDPKHTKTLLNKGIVLAFGKQDLNGAAESWKRVVELAPNSPEAQAAQRGLEGIAAAQGGQRPNGQQGAATNQ